MKCIPAAVLWLTLSSAFAATTETFAGDVESAAAVERLILQEIAALPEHPWAGRYVMRDNRGATVTLALAPANGFAVGFTRNAGTTDVNHGRIDLVGDDLRLTCALPNVRTLVGGIETTYTVVHWGPRAYHVPPVRIGAFCSAVNHGNVPRSTLAVPFFLKDGDEAKSVTGVPDLPADKRSFLLPGEMLDAVQSIDYETTVANFDGRGHMIAHHLTLLGGADEGLRRNHKLRPLDPALRRELITVDEVFNTTCTAVHLTRSTEPTTPGTTWVLTTGVGVADVSRQAN